MADFDSENGGAGRRARRILAIDDSRSMHELLRDALEPAGFELECAESGEEGLAAFDEQEPDLVLLDVEMLEMDGYEVCRRLRGRRHGRGQLVPIVMMTGHDEVAAIQDAYDAGATDFITKPINWLILTHRLRYMLRSSQLRDDFIRSQQHLAEAQSAAMLGSWEHDLGTGELECSEEFRRILGLVREAEMPRWEDVQERIDAGDRERVNSQLERVALEGQSQRMELGIVLPDGSARTLELRARPAAEGDGRVSRIAGIAQDITERKRAEAEIQFLAFHDPLTRLGNRRRLKEHLTRALARRRRHGGTIALVLVGIDQFKRINDTFGHTAGDLLLQRLSARMVDCIRETDYVSQLVEDDSRTAVSRFSGDEFIVLLEEAGAREQVSIVARRLMSVLQSPILVRDQELILSGSLGIAVAPEHGNNSGDLMRKANVAMYNAKQGGGNRFEFYEESMETVLPKNLALEAELRRALERSELVLNYQPKVELSSGEIVGFEALVRWVHPERGLIPPNEFIPVAERTGSIVALGEFVLREACNQARAWQEAGLSAFRMAVNFSPQQFRSRAVVASVQSALQDSGLGPQFLEVEITESTLMENQSLAIDALQKLKEMGVGVSLDDFGTGYSSLSYLKRFPVDTVKIDRTFVRDLPGDADDAAITGAIISMARSLGLGVVAEGVETEEQRTFLAERGCDQMQGYLFSAPLPASGIEELLKKD